MISFPALYAALQPHTAADGRRGELVICTATRRDIGFIWWSCDGSNVVTWHYRTSDGRRGERTTKRACVQGLRDLENASAQTPLPYGEGETVTPSTPSAGPRCSGVPDCPCLKCIRRRLKDGAARPQSAARVFHLGPGGPTPVAAPTPRHVILAQTEGLTAAIAAAFAKHKRGQ